MGTHLAQSAHWGTAAASLLLPQVTSAHPLVHRCMGTNILYVSAWHVGRG